MDSRDWVSEQDMTDVELGLVAAAALGEGCDARMGEGSLGTLRAQVVRQALLGVGAAGVPRRRMQISGARIDGSLDLSDEILDVPVFFIDCEFSGTVVMTRLRARGLQLVRCRFQHGLFLEDVHIAGSLSLADSAISRPDGSSAGASLVMNTSIIEGSVQMQEIRVIGEAQLVDLRINGLLTLDSADFQNEGGVAVGLDATLVAGTVRARGIRVAGEMRALGARFGGDLDLSGSSLINGGGAALSLDGAEVSGCLHASDGFTAQGEVRLIAATVGRQFIIDEAVFTGTQTPAIVADDLNLAGQLRAGAGTSTHGEVRFAGAHFRSSVHLASGSYSNPRGTALHLGGALIEGSLHAQDVRVDGSFVLIGSRIAGDVELTGAHLNNRQSRAVNMDRAVVCGNVNLNGGFAAQGEVNLLAIRVEGGVNLEDSRVQGTITLIDSRMRILGLRNANIAGGSHAVVADRCQIPGGLHAPGLRAEGEFRLPGAIVGGQLDLSGAQLSNPGSDALNLESAEVAGQLILALVPGSQGRINLAYAAVHRFVHIPRPGVDQPPGLLAFTYKSILPGPADVVARDRLRWLATDPAGYIPSSYAALANAYRADGHEGEADEVLIAGEDARYEKGNRLSRTWGMLKRGIAAYGYRPARALYWWAGWLAVGTAFLWWKPGWWSDFTIDGQPMPVGASPVGPSLYLLDRLIPVLDLPSTQAVGIPNEYMLVMVTIYTLFGFVLGAAAVTAIIEVVVKNRRA